MYPAIKYKNVNNQKCYICDEKISGSFQDLFSDFSFTKHSRILLCEMLETIIARPLIKSEKPELNLGCSSCINKINKYDSSITIAKQIQNEICNILDRTESRYVTETLKADDENYEEKKEPFTIYIVKDETKMENDSEKRDIEDFDEFLDNENEMNYISKSEDEEQDSNRFELIEVPDVDIVESKSQISKEKRSRVTNFCKNCKLQFSSKLEYRSHRKKVHSSQPNQQNCVCDICGTSFSSQSRLKTHAKIHSDTNPFKCDICGKHFTQRGALKRHQPIHTGERPYQCEKCGKQFIHYSSFHMHNLAHDDIREKECTICGLKLRSNSHLNRHMRVHTGAKPHECPKCGQKFAQRYNMNVHLRSHEGINRKRTIYKCEICKEKFTKLYLLNEHKCVYHDAANNDNDAINKNKPETIEENILYKCEICQEIFPKLNFLTEHNNVYHNIETNIMYENVLDE